MSKYTEPIKRLFPPGLAWDENPLINSFANIFGDQIEAFDDSSEAFLLERFTHRQKQSLEEWEQALGLDEDCIAESNVISDRFKAVIARRLAEGGQSEKSYIAVAKLFGFEIEIIKHQAFRVGMSTAGAAIGALPFEIVIKIFSDGRTNILAGEYPVGTQLKPDQRLAALICTLKHKAAAYGKIHFIMERL